MGPRNSAGAALLRGRRRLSADHVGVFANVTPGFSPSLGTRTVGAAARSAAVSSLADGIIVGSDSKRDGYAWNPVDRARVETFLAAARA